MYPFFKSGGFTHVPPTPPVFRLVLLHKKAFVLLVVKWHNFHPCYIFRDISLTHKQMCLGLRDFRECHILLVLTLALIEALSSSPPSPSPSFWVWSLDSRVRNGQKSLNNHNSYDELSSQMIYAAQQCWVIAESILRHLKSAFKIVHLLIKFIAELILIH